MNRGNARRGRIAGEAATGSVACGVYLARHSAYLDGELTVPEREAHEAHAAECQSCARYASVLSRGSEVLREVPEIWPSSDFHQRLQHRLFHVRDEAVLASAASAPRGWLAAAAGIALIAGGTVVIEASDPAGESAAAAARAEAEAGLQLADSWLPPAVPVTAPGASFPAFTGYTPVIVRPPLYRPVSYELLAGE